MEDSLPTIQKNWRELGLNFEVQPTNPASLVGNVLKDKRVAHHSYVGLTTFPERLDPSFMFNFARAAAAGPKGGINLWNYIDCEFDDLVARQESVPSIEKRKELVNQALKTWSDDLVSLTIAPRPLFGAARKDTVETNAIGSYGMNKFNDDFMIQSNPKNKDKLIAFVEPNVIQSSNFPANTSHSWPWTHSVHSPLVTRDPELNIKGVIADDWEIENQAKQYTFTLKDATFHNDDPITAEDVKFTINYFTTDIDKKSSLGRDIGVDSVDVIDEKTVQINLNETNQSFLQIPAILWGILHKETWQPAVENPGSYKFDPMIGSGPFKVENYEPGRRLELSGHDGHPEAPGNGLIYEAFQQQNSAFRALKNGELDIFGSYSVKFHNRIEQTMANEVETAAGLRALPYYLTNSFPQAPTKFREYRLAVGKAINRQEIMAKVFQFMNEPIFESSMYLEDHPWAAPEGSLTKFTEEPEGDIEGARQVLSEAGWGWDDNGNLRYPADADLSPRWPKGEEPSPKDFPCLESQ
jgi:peptide/nickel transport system substrate-binding protein